MNDYGVNFREIEIKDLPQIRRWRNRFDIRSKMINAKHIVAHEHVQWYCGILKDKSQKHWAIWVQDVLVGYAGIKGRQPCDLLQQELVETGLYIGASQEQFKFSLSLAAALTQLDYVFLNLKNLEVKTLVRVDNHVAKRFNKMLGYRLRKFNKDFEEQVLSKEEYLKAKSLLLPIFK